MNVTLYLTGFHHQYPYLGLNCKQGVVKCYITILAIWSCIKIQGKRVFYIKLSMFLVNYFVDLIKWSQLRKVHRTFKLNSISLLHHITGHVSPSAGVKTTSEYKSQLFYLSPCKSLYCRK